MESIASLNALPRDEFAAAIRPLFETAPPLADALYQARPFVSYQALIDTAESLARAMPMDDQVAVLNAHPRIGASPSAVSAASYREQGYAAESGLDPAEVRRVYSQLEDLNAMYEARFGFRFVVFVNQRPKVEIIKVLQSRLDQSPAQELATGLREMFQIARDRIGAQNA